MTLRFWLVPLVFALPLACSTGSEPFGDDDVDCSDWNNEEPAHSIRVRIRNARATPIYLGSANQGCQPSIDLFMEDAEGNDVSFRGAGSCGATCELLQDGIPACTGECAIPPTVYVAPGGYWEETWSGNVYVQEPMPEGCYFDDDAAQDTCARYVVAPEGSYTFVTHAWDTAPSCTGPEECTCAPDASGSCAMYTAQALPGTPVEALGTLSYPSDDVVEVVFD